MRFLAVLGLCLLAVCQAMDETTTTTTTSSPDPARSTSDPLSGSSPTGSPLNATEEAEKQKNKNAQFGMMIVHDALGASFTDNFDFIMRNMAQMAQTCGCDSKQLEAFIPSFRRRGGAPPFPNGAPSNGPPRAPPLNPNGAPQVPPGPFPHGGGRFPPPPSSTPTGASNPTTLPPQP